MNILFYEKTHENEIKKYSQIHQTMPGNAYKHVELGEKKDSAEAYTTVSPYFTWLTHYFPTCVYI